MCVRLSLSLSLWVKSFSLSLIFYAISHSSSPPLFICCLSLTHSLFPPHNTHFLTTTAKGLAGAAYPQIPSLYGGLEEDRERKGKEKKLLKLKSRCCDNMEFCVAACTFNRLASTRGWEVLTKPRLWVTEEKHPSSQAKQSAALFFLFIIVDRIFWSSVKS